VDLLLHTQLRSANDHFVLNVVSNMFKYSAPTQILPATSKANGALELQNTQITWDDSGLSWQRVRSS